LLQKRLLTFVHISDTHIHQDPNFTGEFMDYASREPVQKLIEAINALTFDVDFVMHTGDVMDSPQAPQDYDAAKSLLGQLRFPIYYIPGNHDNVMWMQKTLLQRDEDATTLHLDYEFEHNGVQIIMLDSHAPDNAEEPQHFGQIADDQLTWLDRHCSASDQRPLIVGIHHHTLPLEAPWLDRIVLKNGTAVHNTLRKAKARLRGVFYGHIHESTVTVRDGISYYSVQSGWFQTRTWYAQVEPARDALPEPGFNVVTLTEQDTFVRFHRISL